MCRYLEPIGEKTWLKRRQQQYRTSHHKQKYNTADDKLKDPLKDGADLLIGVGVCMHHCIAPDSTLLLFMEQELRAIQFDPAPPEQPNTTRGPSYRNVPIPDYLHFQRHPCGE
jgi:hypothetical protein